MGGGSASGDVRGGRHVGGNRGGMNAGERSGHALVFAPADMGAAFEARVGLRVEAAVQRVAVLAGAALAHGEVLHRRALAIVGQLLDDSEARAAVRASDEPGSG